MAVSLTFTADDMASLRALVRAFLIGEPVDTSICYRSEAPGALARNVEPDATDATDATELSLDRLTEMHANVLRLGRSNGGASAVAALLWRYRAKTISDVPANRRTAFCRELEALRERLEAKYSKVSRRRTQE